MWVWSHLCVYLYFEREWLLVGRRVPGQSESQHAPRSRTTRAYWIQLKNHVRENLNIKMQLNWIEYVRMYIECVHISNTKAGLFRQGLLSRCSLPHLKNYGVQQNSSRLFFLKSIPLYHAKKCWYLITYSQAMVNDFRTACTWHGVPERTEAYEGVPCPKRLYLRPLCLLSPVNSVPGQIEIVFRGSLVLSDA